MAVNLSPIGGVAAQFFDNSGNVLSGGKIFTYAAGTTTPQATYTSAAGTTPLANPIILDAAGRVPTGEIWLSDGFQYKFIIKTSTDVQIGSYDNIIGINSNFVNYTNSQEIQTATAGQTVFTLTTMAYQPATNSLSVFVDGVNQYGPGALYAYQETSSTVVTFTSGLHVGADVKFTTSAINASSYGDASQISFVGFKNQVGNVQDLADADGSNWIGFEPAGTSAVARSAQDKLRDTVSVKDFGAVGDGVTDDTAAIQAAIDYVATIGPSSVGGVVYIPEGQYRITSTIISAPTGGQVGILGAGQFATVFKPDGDFTAIWLRSSYVSSGNFSVEWPATAAASIPTARIGVEFAGPNNQTSYVEIKNITVTYAYRGFIQRDWTGQPLGNIFLITLNQLTAFRCANWGFYLDSKVGSTTLRLLHCYVRGDDFGGSGAYGKGIFASDIDDIYTEQLAIDQCLNEWVSLINGSTVVMNGTALEANKITNAANVAVNLNVNRVVINGLKDISCTYDTGANARLVFFAGNCRSGVIAGYAEQASTVGGGTTKYAVALNSALTQVNVVDRSIVPSQVLNSGFFVNVVFEGRRLSSTGLAPNYGTWLQGDNVLNGAAATGQPKGWVCTVAGSPGTWVSEGNL